MNIQIYKIRVTGSHKRREPYLEVETPKAFDEFVQALKAYLFKGATK